MTDLQTILLVVLLIIVAICIINKNILKQVAIKIRGRSEQIARDDAATTSGASDYFNNAILEKQNLYSNAEKSFAEIAGKLDESEKDLYQLRKDMMKIDKDINSALDRNDDELATQLAMKKVTIDNKIDVLKTTIEELKKAKSQQEEIRKAIKSELDSLKEEKERTLFQMEADQQIIALHEGMNTAASSNESDRMLERVREGARQTRERAAGAQTAYETSTDTLERRAEQASRQQSAKEIVEEMKRKRGRT